MNWDKFIHPHAWVRHGGTWTLIRHAWLGPILLVWRQTPVDHSIARIVSVTPAELPCGKFDVVIKSTNGYTYELKTSRYRHNAGKLTYVIKSDARQYGLDAVEMFGYKPSVTELQYEVGIHMRVRDL